MSIASWSGFTGPNEFNMFVAVCFSLCWNWYGLITVRFLYCGFPFSTILRCALKTSPFMKNVRWTCSSPGMIGPIEIPWVVRENQKPRALSPIARRIRIFLTLGFVKFNSVNTHMRDEIVLFKGSVQQKYYQ